MVLAVSAAAVIFLLAGLTAWKFLQYPIQARIDIQPDADAKSGTLHVGERQEVSADDFCVVINQLPTMEAGSRECNIEYENPAENHYSARISLYSARNGELLGNTRRVDPGYYVEFIQLARELEPGEYPVTVRLELFEKTTPVSELSIDITLRVVNQRE